MSQLLVRSVRAARIVTASLLPPCAYSRCIGSYDPLEIESNNRLYLSRGEVPASDEVRELAWSLRKAGDEAGAPKQPSPPHPLPFPKGFL